MNKKNYLALLYVSIGFGIFQFLVFLEEKSFKTFVFSIAISCLYTFTIGIGNGIVNDYLNKKLPWVNATKKRAVISILVIIIVNCIIIYLCNYVNYVIIQKDGTLEDFLAGKYNFSNWFMINFALLVSAFLHAKSFMEELKKATKQEVVEQKLIAKSANAQFESLKNQLDPHFLFNSLNVLSSLIDENPAKAQDFTVSMSKVYRYVLEQKDKELVTVAEEIEFAKTYCALLKTRFEESVHFVFDVKIEDFKRFVVPLSLQLILENCIKHNFATSTKPLNIKIFSENEMLIVENNLQVREQLQESAGIGLSNIVQRYALLSDKHVFIEKSIERFQVKLPILNDQSRIQESEEYDQTVFDKAQKRMKEIKKFYSNLISYCIIIPFLVILNLTKNPDKIWFHYVMLGWGIGLVSHGIRVFVIGTTWEEKKIKELMKKK